MARLEHQVSDPLQCRIPERIVNHRHRLAIDLHLIPYYGVAEETVLPYLHRYGIQYLLFVVYRVKVTTQQLPQHYRGRFGIETSYRLQNSCRIRTTTRHPVVRLLFVALAFVLVNLWLWLLWSRFRLTHRGGRRVYQVCFRLKTMLEFLHHAIERHFPLLYSLTLPVLGGRL